MTVHDVALYLKVDEKTVYRLTQRAELLGFKVAWTWRFKRRDVDAWIDRQKQRCRQARHNVKSGTTTGGEGQ